MAEEQYKTESLPHVISNIREELNAVRLRTSALEGRVTVLELDAKRHEKQMVGFWDEGVGKVVPGMVQNVEETKELARVANERAEKIEKLGNRVVVLLGSILVASLGNLAHAYGWLDLLGKATSGR
jgi:hypothetical protein